MKMPIIRKLVQVGGSQGVTIPKGWIEAVERKTGQKLTELALEINGVIKIAPVIEKEVAVQQ
jgi:antitoxin component of MazEF toxin-antitoxin module